MNRKMAQFFWPLVALASASLLVSINALNTNVNQINDPLVQGGEVSIGLLVNLHHRRGGLSFVNTTQPVEDPDQLCGVINVDAVQQVLAAKWAVDVINNQSLPHELKIGLQIFDSCNSQDLTQKHLFHVINRALKFEQSSDNPALLGMVGVGESDLLSQTNGALQAFNIPLISASPEHADILSNDENVLTTAPDMSGQARAVASIAYEMNLESVALISSNRKIIQLFLSESTAMGIRVPRILELDSHRVQESPEQVISFLKHLAVDHPTVVLLVTAPEAVAIAQHLKHENFKNRIHWLIGSLGLDMNRCDACRRVYDKSVFVEPHMPELVEFKKFFLKSLVSKDNVLEQVVNEYKEEMFSCTNDIEEQNYLSHCDELQEQELEIRYHQDPQVSFVIKAVSALTAAFRLVQLGHCSNDVRSSCLRTIHDDLHDDIVMNLKKLSFSSMVPSGQRMGTLHGEIQDTQHHFTRNGRLVANKQQVYKISLEQGIEKIGWYSEDEGLHLATDVQYLLTTTSLPLFSPLVDNAVEEPRSSFARSISDQMGYSEESSHQAMPKELKTLPIFSYESFISRTWALIVVSVAIFGFIVSLWMLLYVFQKMCDGTLNGNQTMGVLLLIGVMCLFVSAVPWLLPPNEIVCAVRHFMHPLLMVLCFSILLVKSMQLRSLVTIGLGGSIPIMNQMLSLVFMVTVQVVITIEWYLTTKPIGITITQGYPECGVPKSRFILLHIYPTVLLLLSFFYGISVIKVKRNFNEGRWITMATIFIIPIFAAWPIVYYFAPVPFHDPSVAVSVLAVAGIILGTIFLPKMHTISRQSKIKTPDLSRTHSDATVYTGFSDYVTMSNGKQNKRTLYPIYGYTTNQFMPQREASRTKKRKQQSASPENVYQNINFIQPSSGPHVTNYSDWSKEYSPSVYHAKKHYKTPKNLVNTKPRHSPPYSPNDSYPSRTQLQPSSPTDHNVLDTSTLETVASLKSSAASKRNRSQASAQASNWPSQYSNRSRSQTPGNRGMGSYFSDRNRSLSRQRHSHSPSDGMILTASGLTPSSDDPQLLTTDVVAQPKRSNPGYRVSEVFLTH